MFGIDDALIGGALTGLSGVVTNLFNSNMATDRANQQMAFQERMSSTAYQRGMADMKAAGLNPILAYQKGPASSPTGAMASTTLTDPVASGVNTAMAVARNKAEVANMQQTEQNLRSQNVNIQTDTLQKLATVKNTEADTLNKEIDNQLKGLVLTGTAKRESDTAKMDQDFYSTTAGRILRMLGTVLHEVNPLQGSGVGGRSSR